MNDNITCEELERFFEDFAIELENGQTVPYALQTLLSGGQYLFPQHP